MWFKRPSRTSSSPASSLSALRPWGDAAYLSPYHLPLCIEGDVNAVQVAVTRLMAEAHEQHLPMFLQEGPRSIVSGWESLPVPQRHVLPPFRPETTRETIQQTLLEITEWLSAREGQDQGVWPALLVCSNLGAHRNTVLSVVDALNQSGQAHLGVVYLQGTRNPPLEKPVFASRLVTTQQGWLLAGKR